MRYFIVIASFVSVIVFQSCKDSVTDYATQWTKDIKQKIIEDASQKPDNLVVDSATNMITLSKDNKKLKVYHFVVSRDSSGNLISGDTIASVFYSSDQQFELVREFCPIIERSFEGIKYKGDHVGLAEFRYCDGILKESGFRFNGDIGTWKEYDSTGKVIKEIDHGNIDKLEGLKKIKYSR